MKRTALSILFVAIFSQLISFSQSVYIEPIKFDYSDVVNLDDNMYLLANKGFINRYDINSQELEKIKVFNSGNVIKLYRIDNTLYAFNDLGDMGISNDNAKSWQIKRINDVNAYCVIQDSNYFYVRDSLKIFKIDENGNKLREFQLNSPKLNRLNEVFTPNYLYSMCIFHNNIAIETDSSKILFMSKDLVLQDSIEMSKSEVYLTDSLLYSSGYRIVSYGNYLYVTMYQRSNSSASYTSIYRCDASNNISLIKRVNSYHLRIKVIENKIHYIDFYGDNELYVDYNRLSSKDLTGNFFSNRPYTFFNDYYMIDNDIYLAGKGGIFEKFNQIDSTLYVINEQYWISEEQPPFVLNDSTLIFFSGSNYYAISYMMPYFYISKNNGTYQSTIFINNPDFNDSLYRTRFFIMDYDKEESNFYLIGKYDYKQNPAYAIFYSADTLQTLNFTITNGEFPTNFVWYPSFALEFDFLSTSHNISYANPTIKSVDTLKYYIQTGRTYQQKDYTGFTITNNQYFPIASFVDSGYVLDYVYLKDTNSFVIHCANTSDSGQSEVRYTTNHGASWEYVHKYAKKDTLLKKYDIEFQGKNYLILFHFDGYVANTKMYMDVVDPENYEWRRLREWDLTKENKYFNSRFGLCSDENIINFAIGDTLYTITDIYDQSSWQYKILPDSGAMGDPIVRYENKFIAKYWDKNNYIYGYGLSVIGFDDTLGVNDYAIERKNYFYSYPPYPLPAGEVVQAKIFWDLALDINTADIKVYDVYGKEISDGKDIIIIPETGWSG
ncbi:MAG: hypothetical protein KBA52_07915, partial [Candidatus Kapabacteria bacterium]|nr:hypothetical protein [Candidatus Kapabacteria bacterium]